MKLHHRILRVGCIAALLVGVLLTFRWPLLGDSILMHYVVFLTRHGFVPYRDISEMNLPFTYLVERAGMAVFGTGSAGWRLFDFTIMAGIVVLCVRLPRRSGSAGLFAGTIFAAVHWQDGVTMAGQRDFVVALLQLAALVSLCAGLRAMAKSLETPADLSPAEFRDRDAAWFCVYGVLAAAAVCIKPTSIVFSAATLAWSLFARRYRHGGARILLASIVGSTLPPAISTLYLLREHATGAFFATLRGLVAYHASIERRSLGFLLAHAFSPALAFVLVAGAAALVSRRRPWSMQEQLLALGAAAALISYVLQGKGFPYQRYPFLLFLLLLLCSRVFPQRLAACERNKVSGVAPTGALFATELSVRAVEVVGLLSIALFLSRAAHFSNTNPYRPLVADLHALGAGDLSSHVQCMDTAGTCIGALYNAQLVQSTGSIYDCYFLDAANSTALALRSEFETAFARNPPRVIVVTNSACFTQPRTFDKYGSWPWFQQQLATQYVQQSERAFTQPIRYWSRAEIPYSYRIYQRR